MTRSPALPVAVCLLLAGCAGLPSTAGGSDDASSRQSWVEQTRLMIEAGASSDDKGTTIVLPALNGGDHYTTALAMIGAGRSASELVDSLGRSATADRFRQALSAEQLAKTVAGPATTAAVMLDADREVHLLQGDDLGALREVLDDQLAAAPSDVYEAVMTGRLAQQLDTRTGEALQRVDRAASRIPITCADSESLYTAGAVVSVRPGFDPCGPGRLDALWDAQERKLQAAVTAGGDAAVGLGEAEAVLALARIAVDRGYSADRRSLVAESLGRFDQLIQAGRVSDLTPVSADLALTARVLGRERVPPAALHPYLRMVIGGGGDALTAVLDDGSAAQLELTSRLVGARFAVRTSAQPPVERLELLLVRTKHGESREELASLTERVLADRPMVATARGSGVVLTSLARLGTRGCAIPGAAALVRGPATDEGLRAKEPQRAALALRIAAACGPQPAEHDIETVVATQRATLDRADAGGPAVPTLVEAWQAAGALCALRPAELEGRDLWRLYRDEAAPMGGARDAQGTFVDLDATYRLLTLTDLDRDRCTATGLLR